MPHELTSKNSDRLIDREQADSCQGQVCVGGGGGGIEQQRKKGKHSQTGIPMG